MAHPHTYPTLYDEVQTLSIGSLSKWGYLKSGQHKTGVITWSRGENKTGSISIRVNTTAQPPYLELDYTLNGTPVNYKVNLTALDNSKYGGKIWYFTCPHTGKRARKLYNVGGKFLHRTAFVGCMYEIQTLSKKGRQIKKAMDGMFARDHIPDRYFRPYYRGKPTRTLKRILRKEKQAVGFSLDQLF